MASTDMVPGLSRLWAESLGDPRILVAVLDGPVDRAHPCFRGADLTEIESTAGTTAAAGAGSLHGTHVASLVFGAHDSPVRGLAPRCRGLVIPVFDDGEGGGPVVCSQIELARAITLALARGAHVINISAGQLDLSGAAHPVLERAVRAAADQGALLVTAAGNDGCECLHVPAALPSVLVVGAMDSAGAPLGFSNWSDRYRGRALLAPGEGIEGARAGGGTISRSGTSFAAAIVSGVAALLLGIHCRRTGEIDPRRVRRALLEGAARPGPGAAQPWMGRLDVSGALSALNSGERTKMNDEHHDMTPAQESAGRALPAPVAPLAATPPAAAPAAISPSACGCGTSRAPQPVYALGQIGHDLVSEARRDALAQLDPRLPHDPAALLEHLDRHPANAAAIHWILLQDATPIYAIQPVGAFAAEAYALLREFLRQQLAEGVEQVSIPGTLVGRARLSTGQWVPVIAPEIRGMYSWSTPALVEAALGRPPENEEDRPLYDAQSAEIAGFLERIYYELRNLGITPQERAINHAATNAFQVKSVYTSAIEKGLRLGDIDVERSPLCRPESDCWDVKLTFFHPTKRLEQANVVYRFTVDVSDVVPVTVGKIRHWHVG